ncbi:MAG: hypothetical protein WBE22_02985 [Halobacteriota archaeon]
MVTISSAETDPVTASASTTVSGVLGTSLEITEHGSGIYDSEEILKAQQGFGICRTPGKGIKTSTRRR